MNTFSSALRAAVLLLGLVLVSGGGGGIPPVQAQTPSDDSLSLAERYRVARFRMLVQEYMTGQRALPVQPVERLPVRFDSLLISSGDAPPGDSGKAEADASSSEPAFNIDTVRRVSNLEQTWFRRRFEAVEWSFLGPGTQLTFFDTTRTRTLRARLQAHFGKPTRTLADLYSNEWVRAPDSVREEPIQFEYWFVVNDSIPVRVSDVNGPRERGVIVSTDRRYRNRLEALRAALLQPLRDVDRAPYVDYYYEEATRRWYRVGFDGTSYFRERISRFDITPGRQPQLDTTRTAPQSDPSASSLP